MKLFISERVFYELGEGVILIPLDSERTQLSIFHTVKKEDGTKETTPFLFKFRKRFQDLVGVKENVLVDFDALKVNKNKEEVKPEKHCDEEEVYALFCIKESEVLGQLYIEKEMRDKLKLLYKLEVEDGAKKFLFVKIRLQPNDKLPVCFLVNQNLTAVYPYLNFIYDDKGEIRVDKPELAPAYIRNVKQYICLSELRGLPI